MLGKKVFYLVLCGLFIGLMMLTSLGQAQAAEKTGPSNEPPFCYPIFLTQEGYWGLTCLDLDNNIASADLKTNGDVTHFYWDNTTVQMMVQMDGQIQLIWRVCDSNNACVGGVYQ